jgi:pimeloyl-ACP methyl ester carboxylesterase
LTPVASLATVSPMTSPSAPRLVPSSDGVRLAVHEAGDPRGPVVVAVHGYPDNHAVWDGVAARLAEDVRFVSYDVRGAGESDQPRSRAAYRNAQLGDDLVAVLDAVSPDAPVHLVAHDWGSCQLWRPLSEPRLAGRVASFTSISGPSFDHVAAWMRRSRTRASLRQLLASWYVLAFQLPVLPEAVLRRAPVERSAGGSFPRSEADKVNGINLYRANLPSALRRPRPPYVDVPTLVLVPEDDPFVRPATASQAPGPYVADLTVEHIPGGHWVVAEDPGLVADRVRAFIGRHTARA